MTNARGELTDPAAASGLLHTLRAGRLHAAILAPEEPGWVRLHFAASHGIDLRDRFRGALIGGAIGEAMGHLARALDGLTHAIREPFWILSDRWRWRPVAHADANPRQWHETKNERVARAGSDEELLPSFSCAWDTAEPLAGRKE